MVKVPLYPLGIPIGEVECVCENPGGCPTEILF
jgi:hypothetical protein